MRAGEGHAHQYLDALAHAGQADIAARPSTLTSYRQIIDTHIVPHLGEVQLQALDAATLTAFYGRLLAGGRTAPGVSTRLSPKTVRNVAGVVSKALAEAARWRLIRYTRPAMPKCPLEATEMTTWTADEARRFLVHVAADRLAPLWALALGSGLRRGELLGLRCGANLYVAAGRIACRPWPGHGRHGGGGPAQDTGRRASSPSTRTTLATLWAWKQAQAAERLAAGPAWVDSGYMFTNELGQRYIRWRSPGPGPRSAIAAGVPHPVARLPPHPRHTHATLALAAATPVKVLSQRLGHADISVTLGVYAHATAQDDAVAAVAVGAVLYGP